MADATLTKPIEKLHTCTHVNAELCGELVRMDKDSAEVVFSTNAVMLSDEEKEIHMGFVFNSAAYAALCAVNKANSVVIASECKFLAPIELGHEILFKATAIQNGLKKCEVKVEGFLLNIKVFEGLFQVAVFDKKLFKFNQQN